MDHVLGGDGDDGSGGAPGSAASLSPTDDLRNRMRLRLAMNQPASRPTTDVSPGSAAHSTSTSMSISTSPGEHAAPLSVAQLAGVVQRDRSTEISQLVWNSVLESLNTGMTSAVAPAPAPAASPTTMSPGLTALTQLEPTSVAVDVNPSPIVPTLGGSRPGVASLPLYAQPDPTPEIDHQAIADLFAPAQASTLAELASAPTVPQPGPLYDLPSGQREIYTPTSTPPSNPIVTVPTNGGAEAQIGVGNVIVPKMPVLSQPSRAASTPRPNSAKIGEPQLVATPPVGKKAKKKHKQKIGKQRHPFRAMLGLLVVLAIIGGAAYAGWYFLIRPKAEWSAADAPLAKFVEQTTHHTFTANVPVVTLSAPEYEVKLGLEIQARTYMDADGSFGALRAVGLAATTSSAGVIGHIAASEMTSFYRPEDKSIYRMSGATVAFEVSMLRSMTMALADQHLSWHENWVGLTDAQRVAELALLDGVGASVVEARYATEPLLEAQAAGEQQTRAAAAGIVDGMVPVPVAMVLASYEYGVLRTPAPPTDDPFAGLDAVPPSDAAILDPARDSATQPVGTQPPADAVQRMLGMQFWYEAMLPAIGPAAARTAALTWQGEASVMSLVESRPCISSALTTGSDADAATLSGALTQLASSRPESSIATVTVAGPVVNVTMCEPIGGNADPLAGADARILYTSADREIQITRLLQSQGLQQTVAGSQCGVSAQRAGALDGYEVGSVDPTMIANLTNVANFCNVTPATPATVAPAVDPAVDPAVAAG